MAVLDGRRARKSLLGGAAAIVALGAAWAAYEQTMRPDPLETMIPESAIGFLAGDARWLWDATEEVRAIPEVRDGLAELGKELGGSVEADVAPWAGQAAVAVLHAGLKDPQAAFFIEVRNPIQYYTTMTRIRTRMEREASRHWKGTGYNGVPLRYTYVGSGKTRMPVSTAWLKGWLVVGLGDGTTKRVIDAWQGKKRSVAQNSAWAQTLAALPPQSVSRYGINTGLMSETGPQKMTASMKAATEISRTVQAGALTEISDGFRMVSYATATAPASRRMFGELSRVPAVNAATLDRLPDGTFYSAVISDPGAWWDAYQPLLRNTLAGSGIEGGKEFMDAVVDRYQPVVRILRRSEDGLAIGISYNQEYGFGLSLVGDCGTAEAARASARELKDFVARFDYDVELDENGLVYFVEVPTPNARISFEPAWTASGQYLVAGSHEAWLTPGTGAERLPLPEEATGAQVLGRGNFRFVEPAIAQYVPETTPKGPSREDILRGWRLSGLEDAHWWSTSVIRADGTTAQAGELRNWKWRAAIRAAVETQRARAEGNQATE